jgi:hypothetical protein
MIQHGYLDAYNNPTAVALSESTVQKWSALNHRADELSTHSASAFEAMYPATETTAQLHLETWLPNKDPKSLLNELQHKIPKLILAYDTVNVSRKSHVPAFQATVCLQYENQAVNFLGEICDGKKTAEKTAALAAVKFITGGGLGEECLPEKLGVKAGTGPAMAWRQQRLAKRMHAPQARLPIGTTVATVAGSSWNTAQAGGARPVRTVRSCQPLSAMA